MKLTILLTALSLAAALPAAAQMNYQGRLTGPGGAPLTDASATIVFNIYSAAGVVRWGPFTATVPLTEGRFNVILGPNDTSGTPRNINTAFTTVPPETANPPRFLGIKVGAASEISPRQQILAAPTALHADHATQADTAANFTSVVLKTDEVNARVGIGLADPAEKLDVAGNVKVTGNIATSGNVTASGNLTTTGLTASGSVGIGIPPTPGVLLNVSNNGGANESLRLSGAAINATQGTSTQGISFLLGLNRDDLERTDLMIGNSRKLGANDSVLRIIPGLGNFGSLLASVTPDGSTFKDLGLQDGQMTIKANGNVGIGTATPTQAKLVISGNNFYTLAGNSGYLRQTLVATEVVNPTVANGSVDLPVQVVSPQLVLASVYATNDMLASGFRAFSDERIKRIAGRSDGAHDLFMLKGIEVTDYRYIDTLSQGAGQQKKVIAQQVEKVYPQAVSRSTDVVPDIYRKAEVKDGWVQLATSLKKGERVRLLGGKEEGIHEVLEVAEGRFRTAFKPAGDEVFVFGREVHDFLSVDYEAIAMLNVSATQELARQLAAKDARIAALEKSLAALKAKDEARDTRLAAIEALLTRDGTKTATVSLSR